MLVGPVYSISARRRRAAAEWRTGTETRVRTDPTIWASLRVQVPDWQRGKRNPLKKAAGL